MRLVGLGNSFRAGFHLLEVVKGLGVVGGWYPVVRLLRRGLGRGFWHKLDGQFEDIGYVNIWVAY